METPQCAIALGPGLVQCPRQQGNSVPAKPATSTAAAVGAAAAAATASVQTASASVVTAAAYLGGAMLLLLLLVGVGASMAPVVV